MAIQSKDVVVAADKLFQQYGIRSVSIDDICRELSMSKKTFYVYFSQKEDLVDAVLSHRENEFVRFFDSKLQEKDAVEKFIIVLKGFKGLLSRYNIPVFIYDLQKYHKQTFEKHNVYRNDLMRRSIIHNLNQGINEGYYRSEIDVEMISVFYSVHFRDVFSVMRNDEIGFTEERIIDFLLDMIMRFIVTPKGWEHMQRQIKEIDLD